MVVAALLEAEALTAQDALRVDRGRRRREWCGDLIMLGATLCMALYNVWSRPFIARSSPFGFVTASVGFGAACLVVVAAASGGFAATHAFGAAQWIAVILSRRVRRRGGVLALGAGAGIWLASTAQPEAKK